MLKVLLDIELAAKASTGLGLVVNPAERESADGEEGTEEEAASGSSRHVWIDMTKPMPRPKVLCRDIRTSGK